MRKGVINILVLNVVNGVITNIECVIRVVLKISISVIVVIDIVIKNMNTVTIVKVNSLSLK
jgi:hypothetical protein